MKKYTVVLLIGLSFCFSCNNSKRPSDSINQQDVRLTTMYSSSGNGTADISLRIYDNNTFGLSINYLEENITESYTGMVQETNNSFILVFDNSDAAIGNLFDENYDDNNAFEVLESQNSIAINKYSDHINVWGVYCSQL